jgi:hypothetical protein
MLGSTPSTAVVNFPFCGEQEMCKCHPILDCYTCSVDQYSKYIIVNGAIENIDHNSNNMLQVHFMRDHCSVTKQLNREYIQDSDSWRVILQLTICSYT